MDPDALFTSVVDDYSEYINPYLAKLMAFAGFPVEMRAEGCMIYDQEGRGYVDCLGGYGVFSLGHRHPKIVEAVKRQLDLMPMSGKAFFNKPQADLASKLAKTAPIGLKYSFFCNSGAEAVEAALKFAKAVTGRTKIVSTLKSFHGKTLGALSTTGQSKYQLPFAPMLPGVEFVDFGDVNAAIQAIDNDTACFIVEPVQGEGGIIVPPDGYLRELREACDRFNALLIVDEVQTGLGRTGLMFGCDRDGITPDMMPLAKALGGGVMPIGCLMGTPTVWDALFSKNPLLHTSTFGGNELACAAGLATLDVIQEEALVEKSAKSGQVLMEALGRVKENHPDLIKEVRGRGLMIGVEFQMDEVGELTVAQMLKRGLVAAYTLNNPKVMRFEPPLIISEEQIEFVGRMFEEAVSETSELLASLV